MFTPRRQSRRHATDASAECNGATLEDSTLRTPLIVLMSSTSPWSQQVVRTLADRFDIDVLDCNSTADASQRSAVENRSIEELRGVCRVHFLPPRFGALHLLRGARRLRSLLGSRVAPVLCLYGGMQATMAWLSGVRPYVVFVVGSDVLKATGLRRRLVSPTLRAAARVFANGSALTERARALAPSTDVQQLYLGIDVPRYRAPAARALDAKFVTTRAFRPLYDNATIVSALAELTAVPDGFACAFLSSGELLEETKALADSIITPAVRGRVTFAGGVSDEQLIAMLHGSAVYISASLSDGASSSLLEAMAAGLFPIVSDIPANREWISHRENGILFPPGDRHALAAAMTETFTPAPWMDRARARNQELVMERGNTWTNLGTLADALAALAAPGAR